MNLVLTWYRRHKLASYEARVAALEAKVKFLRSLTSTRDDAGLPWSYIMNLEESVGDIASLKWKISYLRLKLGVKD